MLTFGELSHLPIFSKIFCNSWGLWPRIFCSSGRGLFMRLFIVIPCHISISSWYSPAFKRDRSWFSMISRQIISVYLSSIPFPVTIRIFFSSVAIIKRSPLLRFFSPIPFSLKILSPISKSSFHCLWGKSTTTICSPVFLSCSAKSSLIRCDFSWLSTHEKSLMYFSSFGKNKGFIWKKIIGAYYRISHNSQN